MNGFIDYNSEFMQVKLISALVNKIFLPFKLFFLNNHPRLKRKKNSLNLISLRLFFWVCSEDIFPYEKVNHHFLIILIFHLLWRQRFSVFLKKKIKKDQSQHIFYNLMNIFHTESFKKLKPTVYSI